MPFHMQFVPVYELSIQYHSENLDQDLEIFFLNFYFNYIRVHLLLKVFFFKQNGIILQWMNSTVFFKRYFFEYLKISSYNKCKKLNHLNLQIDEF